VSIQSFPPSRRHGYTLQIILVLVLLVILAGCIWQASLAKSGPDLVLWSLACLVAFTPILLLGYRIYALTRGNYLLDREALTIRWGLRIEQIPISDIEWVRSADDLTHPIHLPVLSTTGAFLGVTNHPDLGKVEFLADDRTKFLLIATSKRIFVISPNDPLGFVQDFQRIVEMGSLGQSSAQSVFPSFVVIQAWQNRLVRSLWIAGFVFNIGLLVWVSLLVPSLPDIPLGFLSTDIPRNIVPGIQLFLLPIISITFSSFSWLIGMTQYRRPILRPLAYLTWGFSALSGLLFLLGVWFIINTPSASILQ